VVEGRGAKRVAVEKSVVVLKIYREENRKVWFAECVEIDDDGEIPATSMSNGGMVKVKAIAPFTLGEIEDDTARYERA
jgi:hypothetical protein